VSKRRGEKALNIAKRRKRQRKRRKETYPSEKVGLRRKRQRKRRKETEKILQQNTKKERNPVFG